MVSANLFVQIFLLTLITSELYCAKFFLTCFLTLSLGPNGKMSFSIISGNEEHAFVVDSTGLISLNKVCYRSYEFESITEVMNLKILTPYPAP